MKAISAAKAKDKSYTMNILGECKIDTIKLPTKGTYASLTIDGGGHTVTTNAKTLMLTGNLTLKNVTITSAKGAWTLKTGGFKLTADLQKLINCTVK